jgi:exodeoxyribonuclease VII large subunit
MLRSTGNRGELGEVAVDPSQVPPRPRAGEREHPLTVAALVRAAATLFDQKIGLVWVEGEVSNLRTPPSGHVYFALTDARAQLPAIMWRSQARRLGFELEEGRRIVCRGKLGIYPPEGRVQLYVDAVEPAGVGAAALRLEQLKRRLQAEGCFDPARKRTLPRLPRKIAVVTSPSGAAVRDILRAVERRFPRPIVISPCRVQGEMAAADIAWAVRRAGRTPGVDVVIVGRGGGSAEDLSAFNEEAVVRAICACPVPVISAVGHESDVTLADLAADVRAATPTAAAEIAVPERDLLAGELAMLERRLRREMAHALSRLRAGLERLEARVVDPRRRLERQRQEVAALLARAAAAAQRALAARRARLAGTAARLDAMSPLRVLERGYAIARNAAGAVVTRPDMVAPGEALTVRVSGGSIDAEVTAVHEDA